MAREQALMEGAGEVHIEIDETIDVRDKDVIMFSLSGRFKDYAGKWAQLHGRHLAEVARAAVAVYVVYDLASEPSLRKKSRKYATPEDRKEAQQKRERDKRDLVRRLMNAYRSGAVEADV